MQRLPQEREGPGQVVHLWSATWRQQHLDDIHARGNWLLQPAQPEHGGAAQELALVFIHAPCRASRAGVQRTFHLHEYQHVAMAADDIHLAASAHAELAAQNLVSPGPQPGACHQFAVCAHIGAARARAISPGAVPVV